MTKGEPGGLGEVAYRSSSSLVALRSLAGFFLSGWEDGGTGICGRERPGTRLPYNSPRRNGPASGSRGGAKPNLPFGLGTAPCFSKEAILSRSAFGPATELALGRTCEDVFPEAVCAACCCWRAAMRALRSTGGTGVLVVVLDKEAADV